MPKPNSVSLLLLRDRLRIALRGGVVGKIAIVALTVVAFSIERPKPEMRLTSLQLPEFTVQRTVPKVEVKPVRKLRPKIWRRQIKPLKPKPKMLVQREGPIKKP